MGWSGARLSLQRAMFAVRLTFSLFPSVSARTAARVSRAVDLGIRTHVNLMGRGEQRWGT
jgi:hypothetical protein